MRPSDSHIRNDLNEWDDTLQYLFDLLEPPLWHKDALCKEYPDVNFFPERGDTKGLKACKEICARCPVAEECFDAGYMAREGVWGGLSANARKRGRPKRQAARCGTYAGYTKHVRRREPVCEPCRQAQRDYDKTRLASKRGVRRREYQQLYRQRLRQEALRAAREWDGEAS